MFKQIITKEELALKSLTQEKKSREVELIKLLSETDFKVLPDYDQPIGTLVEDRQAWRTEIREIQDWLQLKDIQQIEE